MLAMGPGREGFSVRPADLLTCKQEGRPIAALTAWDALSAALVEQAGADLILSNCDIHSNDGATFDVPSGSLISGINSMASSTCSVPATQRLGGATPRVSYSATAPAPAANGYFFQ